MLPATCPPNRMVWFVLESSPSILAHLAMNAALSAGSLAVNAAIRLAAGSRSCSKKIGRSPSVTSRSRTSLVMRHSRQSGGGSGGEPAQYQPALQSCGDENEDEKPAALEGR